MEFTLIDNELRFEYEGILYSLRRSYDPTDGGFYCLYIYDYLNEKFKYVSELFIDEIDLDDAENDVQIEQLKDYLDNL